MNFVYPDINFVFNTTEKGVHTLVIENQSMFQTLITDIYDQIQGSVAKVLFHLKISRCHLQNIVRSSHNLFRFP